MSAKQRSPKSRKELRSQAAAEHKKHSRVWKWLGGVGAVAAIIGVSVGAVILNINSTVDTAEKIANAIITDNGDLKIDWSRYATYDITLDGSLNIIHPGTYHLTGEITDGMITVSAGDGVVRLILDNVAIKNSSGPAILCDSAEDLVIELVGENYVEDGAEHASDIDTDARGAIYSKDDLTFQGDGKLTVVANFEDGIVSKDDLKFNSGTYDITSVDDGIRGTDSVYIVGGNFTINSTGDGIKSTNEDKTGKGFVLIENGTFDIKSGLKGIKASRSILVYDGEIKVNSYDDGVHSNNYIGIVGGNFTIYSGDDGMHADRELIVDGGTIIITKSYEGLEAQAVTINGGQISIMATDDGINAGGGADSSSQNRAGANPMAGDENCILEINGGEVYINAAGDGVDSNGYLYFNGGTVSIDGPTNNGDGAIDSGISVVMHGGTVVAVGASGMAETLGASSSIYNISVYFTATQVAGTTVEIRDANGETILTHTSAKTFNHLAAGSAELKLGATYTIYLGGEEYQSFTITDTTTTVGKSNVNQNNMPSRNNRNGQTGGQK